jgi:uncharacterized membrane protein
MISYNIPFLNESYEVRKSIQIGWIFAGPMAFGSASFALHILREDKAVFQKIFDGFQEFGKTFIAYLIMGVLIVLQLLLLIIPGIIAALSYSLTFYLLRDNPSMGAYEAIQESRILMRGHKLRLFNMVLRFIGLGFLCILTCGIGFLWLVPYYGVCMAAFYEDIIDQDFESEEETY